MVLGKIDVIFVEIGPQAITMVYSAVRDVKVGSIYHNIQYIILYYIILYYIILYYIILYYIILYYIILYYIILYYTILYYIIYAIQTSIQQFSNSNKILSRLDLVFEL